MQIQKTHFNSEACLKQFESKISFTIISPGKTVLIMIIQHLTVLFFPDRHTHLNLKKPECQKYLPSMLTKDSNSFKLCNWIPTAGPQLGLELNSVPTILPANIVLLPENVIYPATYTEVLTLINWTSKHWHEWQMLVNSYWETSAASWHFSVAFCSNIPLFIS